MKEIPVILAVEDPLSDAILRIILLFTRRPYIVCDCYIRGGFGYLKRNIRAFNNAAQGIPYLLLTDLDAAECPVSLIQDWLPHPKHHNLLFRVAVREVESWILADRDSLAKYFGIEKCIIPQKPDNLANPKEYLIGIARKSRKRKIKDALVPRHGSTATQGPDYNGELINYAWRNWRVLEASNSSPSLKRTINVLMSFKPRYREKGNGVGSEEDKGSKLDT